MTDYLNCFRYGCPPHGGFGPGLGRLLMTVLGLDSLREATFLFRGPNRLAPDTSPSRGPHEVAIG
jgi:aspartyl-tRNA synthetase